MCAKLLHLDWNLLLRKHKEHKELDKINCCARSEWLCLQHYMLSKTLVLQRVWLFSEVDLHLSVVQLAVLGSPVFPHLHRAIGGQTLHPEAHLLGKLRYCRNAKVRTQVWHTMRNWKKMEELKENGGQMHKGDASPKYRCHDVQQASANKQTYL